MALNQRYTNAQHISIPAPYDVEAGAPLQAGHIAGVAQQNATAGEQVTVWLDGSWDIPVSGSISGPGATVYITETGELTASAVDATPWGTALATKLGSQAPLEVVPLGYLAPAPVAAVGASEPPTGE